MKFIILFDVTSNSFDRKKELITNTVNAVNKINLQHLSTNEYHNTELTTQYFFLNNGIPVDSDTQLLLNILTNEKNRTPLIMDDIVASYHPELIKQQDTIVLFDFNEPSAYIEQKINNVIALGARIQHINQFFLDSNWGNINIVDLSQYEMGISHYVYIANQYISEHCFFPIILLPRFIQSECIDEKELVIKFEERYNYLDKINWVTSINKHMFNDIEFIDNKCKDIAVHDINDSRIIKYKTTTKTNELNLKQIKI